ncbi:MAG: sensor histidine kinase, partial [Psychromonas sp.]
ALNDLRGLQGFYSANKEKLSLDEFKRYVDLLGVEDKNYIQALSWIHLVKNEDKASFEKVVRAQQPGFNIVERDQQGQLTPTLPKELYAPVTYLSSDDVNKKALGFDLNSNEIRRNSLEIARNSGKMTTTAKINLVQRMINSTGVLIIAPVYSSGVELNTIEQRIDGLLGYTTGVFRIYTLVENIKAYADTNGLELTLLDISNTEDSLLYGEINDADLFRFDLTVPGREWQLRVSLNDELLESIESPSIVKWILAGGIVISLLLGFAIYALLVSNIRAKNITALSNELQSQNDRLEKKVLQRTQSLADKNSELKENVEELKKQRVLLSHLMKEAEKAKVNAELHAVDLARSNKELDEFAYVASHDLKAPLRGIDQLATWVMEDIEEGNLEEVSDHLTMMRSRIKRLESLLKDLLEYSQVNHRVDSISEIDTHAVVNELFVLVSPLNSFSLVIDGDLPVLSTFKAPFEQVIRNLLNNAIKHHHKETGIIVVNCVDQGDFYRFMVKDDGPGVPLQYQEEIFKMFKTLKPRDEREGSGMGLALIKKIVEYSGGQVDIESTEGAGCAFYFTWPKQVNRK